MAVRKNTRPVSAPRTTPRHLWLAALGAVAVLRREALGALGLAATEAGKFGRQAGRLAGDARDVARGVAITLGERVEEARAGHTPARRTRRPARKSPTRSASARKQAATRVARKGRG